MNHVVIVRKNKIKKIEMAENIAYLVSIVSKPINADLLSKLIEFRNNNSSNPSVSKFYNSVLRFFSSDKKFSDGSTIISYSGIENVIGDWFNEIRQTMTIVANEYGEKTIANHVKPSSGILVNAYLTSFYNSKSKSSSLSTFNVISVQDSASKAKLIIKDNGIEHHADVNDGMLYWSQMKRCWRTLL